MKYNTKQHMRQLVRDYGACNGEFCNECIVDTKKERCTAALALKTANEWLANDEKPDHAKHYKYEDTGVKIDPYRILDVYGITHPAHQHAIKKLLRAGKSVKDLDRDIEEVIMTLQRWQEMLKEEK